MVRVLPLALVLTSIVLAAAPSAKIEAKTPSHLQAAPDNRADLCDYLHRGRSAHRWHGGVQPGCLCRQIG